MERLPLDLHLPSACYRDNHQARHLRTAVRNLGVDLK